MQRDYRASFVALINTEKFSIRAGYANTFKLSNAVHLTPSLLVKSELGDFHIHLAWIIFKFSIVISKH